MAHDPQFKKEFLEALDENLYMKPSNRKFLEEHFDELPERVLKQLFQELKKENDVTEKYIEIALAEDPSIVEDMKSTVKKMKNDIVELKESEEKNGLEEKLEEELENL